MVIRTTNEKWDVGKHEKPDFANPSNSSKYHLGPNEYQTKNNKLAILNNLKMYWDDEPPLLLSETEMLKGNNNLKISPEKLQSRIVAAMDAMFHQQEPGRSVRSSLSSEHIPE